MVSCYRLDVFPELNVGVHSGLFGSGCLLEFCMLHLCMGGLNLPLRSLF
jgi:hypothetical protein